MKAQTSPSDAAYINHPSRLQRWEKRTEWPLAIVASVMLTAYSVRVLTQLPESATELIWWTTSAVFGVDYLVRVSLATNRVRWFFRHLIELAIVALPVLRPLRLLRLLVLFKALQSAAGGAIRGRVIIYAGDDHAKTNGVRLSLPVGSSL